MQSFKSVIMRLIHFIIVIIAVLLFLIPNMKRDNHFNNVEQQEEIGILSENNQRIEVIYEVQNPNEEPMADILWIKKAAKTSLESGTPYFNIIESKIKKRFVNKHQTQLPVIEGTIELEDDPMKADYDAYEIEDLNLAN